MTSDEAVLDDYSGASALAIQRHYDISNDFYALWLDTQRVYSCALWGPGDTLEQAQLAKLDYLIDGARAAGTARVLDVGCGWGALLRRLTGTHGVSHATGLTLSEAQRDHVAAAGDPRIDVRLENWADHQPDGPYDAVISIGAFEHFADFGLSRADRIAAYRRFFEQCGEWLPAGGRLGLQTVIKGSNTRMSREVVRDLLFIIDQIFTESELPWLSEVLEASERVFEPVSVRNDGPHYARTCAEWRARLDAHQAEAEALVGPGLVADYQRYLSSSVTHFERQHLGLARIVMARV